MSEPESAEPRPAITRSARGPLVSAAAVVVIGAGLQAARPVAVPILVAVLLTILAGPIVLWLQRSRVPSFVAVSLVIVGLVAVIAVFGMLLSSAFRGFSEALPGYQMALLGLWGHAVEELDATGLQITEDASLQVFDPNTAIDMVTSLISGVLSTLSKLALVLIIVVFMLLEVAGFPRKLRVALSNPEADLGRWGHAVEDVQRYLGIKTGICVATGVLIGGWLAILGIDFPILWGLLAFMLNYVPSIGSILAAIPALLVAAVQPGVGVGAWIGTATGYVVVNVALGNLLEPQLMGRRFGLSPLVVFLSLLLWGWLWGPVGMLLSVPLTMVARIILEQHESTLWLAVLLGPQPRQEPAL